MTADERRRDRSWLWSRSGLVLVAFLLIAGFFVLTEHTAHVLGVLPYLLPGLPAAAPLPPRARRRAREPPWAGAARRTRGSGRG
jgi:hypothetical protein